LIFCSNSVFNPNSNTGAVADRKAMYGSVEEVKIRVGLDVSDTFHDRTIASFIEEADALIDAILEANGFRTPLEEPPARVRKLSSAVASLLFIAWRSQRREDAANYMRLVREELRAFSEELRNRAGIGLTGETD
jgi:hypothetical protein